MKKNNSAFSLIEISIVLIIISILTSGFFISLKLIDSAKLSHAVNLTANAKFLEDDSLSLWIETSALSRYKKNNEKVLKLKDLSKNALIFENNDSSPIFKNSKVYKGLKSIYFNGSNYLESTTPLFLNTYTIFVVLNTEVLNSSILYSSGFMGNINDFSNNKIVVLKNNGANKYIKRNAKGKFELISNSDNLISRPSKFYIGNNGIGTVGFKGELLEFIVFDIVLSDKAIENIENYLYNKYNR